MKKLFLYLVIASAFLSLPAEAADYNSGTQQYDWEENLSVSGTKVKVAHIQEIKQVIDDIRSRCGQAAYSWTGVSAARVLAGNPITGNHISDLKTAIKQTYLDGGASSAGVPSSGMPGASGNTVWLTAFGNAGSQITHHDIEDMRLALNNISPGCAPPLPPGFCGDGSCDPGEDCTGCPGDCGVCPVVPFCGDGSCDPGEDCTGCPGDCGVCPVVPFCGDLNCDPGEDWITCPSDCGMCTPSGGYDGMSGPCCSGSCTMTWICEGAGCFSACVCN